MLLLALSPPAVILLWMAVVRFDGSLSAMLADPAEVAARWPWPSWTGVKIVAGWVALQAALLRLLPGPEHLGRPAPSGACPRYRLNGVSAFVTTHVLLWLAAFPLGLLDPALLYDHFGELLMTSSVAALVLCAVLLVLARLRPTPDAVSSGDLLWDFVFGVELHPRLAGMDLKQLVNCRVAMMGWSAIVLSFAAKQVALAGALSPAMLVSVSLHVLYVFKFFVWESGYFGSLDITHDRFGFYLTWGILAWLPGVYTLAPLYLVEHPGTLTSWSAAAILVFGAFAILFNYQADAQRQRTRATGGHTQVWGRPPEIIAARYVTADGSERQNLLLASGWWGVARHFHYTTELAVAVAWTLPVGFEAAVPWVYPVFLAILLFHRAQRDDRRCGAKYGPAWQEYCRRVPWRILPGIY